MQFSSGGGSGGSTVAENGAIVATGETTASAAYVDLATVGPTFQITVGASGILIIELGAGGSNTGANTNFMSVALAGANVLAASDNNSEANAAAAAGVFERFSGLVVISGLVVGVTTLTAKYRTSGGTATFNNRHMAAWTS
jgi:hypothetical protein